MNTVSDCLEPTYPLNDLKQMKKYMDIRVCKSQSLRAAIAYNLWPNPEDHEFFFTNKSQ